MKHDPLSPCVGLGRTRDIDAPALKFISPQRAVASTRSAITRRGRLSHLFEAPLNCTAVARTLDHFCSASNLLRLPRQRLLLMQIRKRFEFVGWFMNFELRKPRSVSGHPIVILRKR